MIEKNINETLVKKDIAARSLIASLFELDHKYNFDQAAIYHQFPIYPNNDGESTSAANVIFLSKNHGLFIFECIEYNQRDTLDIKINEDKLAEIDRLIFAKILKESPNLQLNRRSLKIEIVPLIYLPNYEGIPTIKTSFDFISNLAQLDEVIMKYSCEPLTSLEFMDLKSTIEGSKAIPKFKERNLKNSSDLKNSKGAILSAIENEICNFDLEQKRAALFILDGAQRIRGLAGSGKTIILTMKTALIHLQNPDAVILYTYYTKSLNDIVKKLITRFYRQFADRDPNWNNIQIMHAWGGKHIEGVYYNACIANDIRPINLSTAKFRNLNNPFDFVCEELNKVKLDVKYDYTLIDEAQDFPPNFYRICRQITLKNRVIWAYDDFQNILNIDLQNERETFGKDENNNFYVDFSKKSDELQDLVLHKCYRNPRKILTTAFSLGLGVYNLNNGGYQMIQRLENNDHWESLGFKVVEGFCKDGEKMTIERPDNNSSKIKNDLLDGEDIISIYKGSDLEDEIKYIVKSIISDLENELRPEDISVVCMDTHYSRKYFERIELLLSENGIKSFNLLNVPSNNKYFKIPNHVTLTTIYNAKGNESGSVFIAGIDAVFKNKNDITERNKIFTAMTRSLAWVHLSGVGESVNHCIQEIEDLKTNHFQLKFNQPSEFDVRTIRQNIDTKQRLLNRIERIAEEMESETGYSKEEIAQEIKNQFVRKK